LAAIYNNRGFAKGVRPVPAGRSHANTAPHVCRPKRFDTYSCTRQGCSCPAIDDALAFLSVAAAGSHQPPDSIIIKHSGVPSGQTGTCWLNGFIQSKRRWLWRGKTSAGGGLIVSLSRAKTRRPDIGSLGSVGVTIIYFADMFASRRGLSDAQRCFVAKLPSSSAVIEITRPVTGPAWPATHVVSGGPERAYPICWLRFHGFEPPCKAVHGLRLTGFHFRY